MKLYLFISIMETQLVLVQYENILDKSDTYI